MYRLKKEKNNENNLTPLPLQLHALVVKQPKCHLVREAASLISNGQGITSSNLIVSYLLENISLIRQITYFVTAWTLKRTTQTFRCTYT